MITGISGFGLFFVQKWPFRDSELFSTKWVAETPIFYSVFDCALFGPSCQKREILDTHQKKKKLTDNWKALFGIFAISLFFCPLFSFFCFFFFFICFSFFVFLFFGGFKGQVRWPEGPPHLALNPPCFFLFLFLFFFVLFVVLEGLGVRWGGPKGHLTWP